MNRGRQVRVEGQVRVLEVLWRRWAADEPGETGWTFETVSVHAPGYYE